MASTTERGYGGAHQRARRRYQALLDQGQAFTCPRCARPVVLGMAWDLDHTDDRTGYHGPAHRSCNRGAGAAIRERRRARIRVVRLITSRSW